MGLDDETGAHRWTAPQHRFTRADAWPDNCLIHRDLTFFGLPMVRRMLLAALMCIGNDTRMATAEPVRARRTTASIFVHLILPVVNTDRGPLCTFALLRTPRTKVSERDATRKRT